MILVAWMSSAIMWRQSGPEEEQPAMAISCSMAGEFSGTS